MARLIDVTSRRLQQLAKDGLVPREIKGRYDPFKVAPAYIRYVRDRKAEAEENGRKKLDDLNAARREEILLNMEIKRRERIPIEVLEEVMSRCLANVVGIVKARRGRLMSDEAIEDILGEIRATGPAVRESFTKGAGG